MNKKGQNQTLWLVIELMLVLTIVGFGAQVAYSFSGTTSVVKNIAAENFVQAIHVVSTSSQDIVTKVPSYVLTPQTKDKLPLFTVAATSTHIVVRAEKDTPITQAQKPYYLPQGMRAEGIVKSDKPVCLEKKSNVIVLRECKPNEI